MSKEFDNKKILTELDKQRILVSQCFGSISGKIDKARQESRIRFAIILAVQILMLSALMLIALQGL